MDSKFDREEAIEEILDTFEKEGKKGKFALKSYLNQPDLIKLCSSDGVIQYSSLTPNYNNVFNNFTINLPRPALQVQSIQLLKSIIPQAQVNIPDYSLVFPYYRLRTVPTSYIAGEFNFVDTPSYDNLYFIRLLPSNYKNEQLTSSEYGTINNFGMNKTFNDYVELEQELKKACIRDITFQVSNDQPLDHFISDDIEISFSIEKNKFIFTPKQYNIPPITNTYTYWSDSVTYSQDTIVQYNKLFYKSLDNGNINHNPQDEDGEIYWKTFRPVDLNTYPIWNFTLTYNKYEVVLYLGGFYMALQTSTDISPSTGINNDYWQYVTPYFSQDFPVFNSYIIAGYDDPNVKQLLDYIQYHSQLINADNEQTSIIGNISVSGQTLARRLGFTWNGNGFFQDLNSLLNTGVNFGSTIATLLNRFRPIIRYIINVEEVIGDPPPFYSQNRINYTADAFCNLVYSGVINIYTSIIGTSSTDSTRNSNLIGMVEMNCGNLGVSMVNNTIDTKLTKIQPDIYSIYIELLDENSQPYYLSNNSVVSLLLKLTY